MQLMMRRPEITGFISLAPPADVHDFTFLAPCPASGQIIHGERDEIVAKDAVDKLAQKLSSQKNIVIDYETVAGADHFFSDKMDVLNKLTGDYLDRAFAEEAA